MPKRSHINSFKFANFPRSFVLDLKKICSFKQSTHESDNEQDNENYEREALQLNKLESYLLKLVIPFIRIAHCPRGPYFKVKGDLILISSDIHHSMSKILPIQQSLIPVCFKRKLSYTGSYIEEFVEKEKIEMYYSWFSKNNHLYKDIQLDTNLIDNFIDHSKAASKEFEDNTKTDNDIYQSDEEEFQTPDNISELRDDLLSDDINEIFFDKTQHFEPNKSTEGEWTHNQTTMFLNKYCEDPNIPTVANRVADIIVDYESHKEIRIQNEDDFEIDDEIINEEEFLKHLDEELDSMFDNNPYQEQLSDEQESTDFEEQTKEDYIQLSKEKKSVNKDKNIADGLQSEETEVFNIEEPLKDISYSQNCS